MRHLPQVECCAGKSGDSPRNLSRMSRQLHLQQFARRLEPKVPKNTATTIAGWIVDLNVEFVISRPRKSKLGDFRPPHQNKPARISVNADLNPYNFLITTVHEFAHLGCFLKHGQSVLPHGAEWKKIYVEMLRPFLAHSVFPETLATAVRTHIARPVASSCSCPVLSKALVRFDANPGQLLDELQPGEVFAFRDKLYRVIEKRRTRFLCHQLSDGRKFLISGRAKVQAETAVST